jgi:hypothetical protein
VDGRTRIRLAGDLTLYVRTDGNDDNDGLEDTPERALATIQQALNSLYAKYDGGSHAATISIAAGSYPAVQVNSSRLVGFSYVQFTGAGPTTIIGTADSTAGFSVAERGPDIRVKNVCCRGAHAFRAFDKGFLLINGPSTADGSSYALHIHSSGIAVLNSDLNISRTSVLHGVLSAAQFGMLFLNPGSRIQHTVPLSVGTAYAVLYDIGYIASYATFSGSVTGKRYGVATNSRLNVVGAGANYFPGNQAGYVETGGLYS